MCGEPSPAREPGHALSRQSSSGILLGGAGREARLIFPRLVYKNEISNKHGELKSSAQLVGENKSWFRSWRARPACSTAPAPRLSRRGSSPCPRPCPPTVGTNPSFPWGRTAGQTPARLQEHAAKMGQRCTGLRAMQSNAPTLQVGKLRPRGQEGLPLPEQARQGVGASLHTQ